MLKQIENKSNGISDDGIIIKVYTESATRLDNQNKNVKNTKKIDFNSRGGCDRRSQLLARVHQLRGLQSLEQQHEGFPEIDGNPNLNRKRGKVTLFSMAKIGLCYDQCFDGAKKEECGYEKIVTEEYEGNNTEELRFEEAARTRSPKKRKSKDFLHHCIKMKNKLKGFLKNISCIWHCKKY